MRYTKVMRYLFLILLFLSACGSNTDTANTTTPNTQDTNIAAPAQPTPCSWYPKGIVAPDTEEPPTSGWETTTNIGLAYPGVGAYYDSNNVFHPSIPGTITSFIVQFMQTSDTAVWVNLSSSDTNITESCPSYINDQNATFTFSTLPYSSFFITINYMNRDGNQTVYYGN
jgi:hypothetical protein